MNERLADTLHFTDSGSRALTDVPRLAWTSSFESSGCDVVMSGHCNLLSLALSLQWMLRSAERLIKRPLALWKRYSKALRAIS